MRYMTAFVSDRSPGARLTLTQHGSQMFSNHNFTRVANQQNNFQVNYICRVNKNVSIAIRPVYRALFIIHVSTFEYFSLL